MTDYILRATAANGQIRAFIASTRHTVEEARRIHGTSPVMTAALGRLLTGSAIMGAMLKDEQDILTLTVKGNGPGGGVLATADSAGHVKGYAFKPHVEILPQSPGKLDVGGAIGAGSLTVVKDLGLKEPYVGQVELVTGEIAEDLAYYFTMSEQTPSAVALGVLVDTDCTVRCAGGFVLQLLPGATEETIGKLESVVGIVQSVTAMLDQGMSPEDMAEFLLGGIGFEITDRLPVEYACNCSREKVEKALISVGREDVSKILEEDGQMTMNCHFCGTDYEFDSDALRRILETMRKA